MSKKETTRAVYGVFEGGGARGPALVGGVAALEKQNITFRAVAGTSAGAIVASLVAAGYSASELLNMMLDKDFQDFKDPVSRIPVLRHLIAWQQMGFYKGDEFYRWIREKISLKITGKRNCSPSFKDLPIPLTVIATDLHNKREIVFSKNNSPELPVADAVRMSMSIPYFFRPVRFGSSLVVDGGLISNFPAWIFQQEENLARLPILGLRLEPDDLYSTEINGPLTLGGSAIDTTIRTQTMLQIANIQDLYIINLPTLGVKTTDFEISVDKKEQLYKAGYDRTQAYFSPIVSLTTLGAVDCPIFPNNTLILNEPPL
jgi:NTE family protein